VSYVSMTTRLHSELSCAMMLSVFTSVRHHSLMSYIQSLLGLPLLFSPSMIQNSKFFTSWLSSILQMCPNNLSFLSMISCITFFLMSNLCRRSKSCYNKCVNIFCYIRWHSVTEMLADLYLPSFDSNHNSCNNSFKYKPI